MGGEKSYKSLGIRDYGFDLWNRPAPAMLEGVEIETDTAATASAAVKYTWMGDMDLDGKVTVKDYNLFLHYYFNPPPPDDITWMTGDFNYDGRISVQDYNMFIQGYFYAQGRGTLSADEQIPNLAPVPEPTTLALLALGALALLRRRRRLRRASGGSRVVAARTTFRCHRQLFIPLP